MSSWLSYLKGGDLRSIANVDKLIPLIQSQSDFDELFQFLNSTDRLEVMRASDAIEKITISNPQYLQSHKKALFYFLETAQEKEFKWHLALLMGRLTLTEDELPQIWQKVKQWALDESESTIVRVNSLQTLHDLLKRNESFKRDFELTIQRMEGENVPSINARIRILRRKLRKGA